MAQPPKIDRQSTTPFLLRLFYRNGAFHRPDEFFIHPQSSLPPHVQVYTWHSCALKELTHLLTTALPTLFSPASVGTRLCFKLIFPDTQGSSRTGPGRYLTKDLGTVVIGAGSESENHDGKAAEATSITNRLEGDAEKTLQDARFVIGDYISCAVFPPLANGDVAAPPRPVGPRADFAGRAPPPPRENGFGGGFGPRRGGGGRFEGGRRFEAGRDSGVPSGEWRRGDVPPGGGFGRGRGSGRGW